MGFRIRNSFRIDVGDELFFIHVDIIMLDKIFKEELFIISEYKCYEYHYLCLLYMEIDLTLTLNTKTVKIKYKYRESVSMNRTANGISK